MSAHWIRLSVLAIALCGWNCFAQSPLGGTAQTSFTLVDGGAAAPSTDGSPSNVGVGYATIQINSGNVVPAGIAVLGFRINGTLVSEVGVPVSPLLVTGRIYTEVMGQINSGVAIANPSNRTATISFFFTDNSGVDFGAGVIVIPPYGQISTFLDEDPFNSGSNVQGSFSFSSDVPISVIALRGLINERGDFLMSTLPVVDTSLPSSSLSATLPHFADGGGWVTHIVLLNPGDSSISGNIRLVSPAGQLLDTFPFSIARRSSFKQPTPGTGLSVRSGSVVIAPGDGSAAPVSVAIFSYRPAGVTISEAGVGSTSGTALRLYTEVRGAPGTALSTQSGVAIANLSASPATVSFDQTGLDGSHLASTTLTVPGNGQAAEFLGDIFASTVLPSPLQGVLKITAPAPGVSVVGLRGRYNERGDFLITTTPPSTETVPSGLSSTYVFPEVVNGGGYSTQFLLFSRSAGQTTNGRLVFADQDGTLPLALNCPALLGGTGTTFPEPIRRVNPQYTDAARQATISGTVIMQGLIRTDGSISVTRFIQTLGYGLDEASQQAIEQWRFCPATQNGTAVAITINITVSFSIL